MNHLAAYSQQRTKADDATKLGRERSVRNKSCRSFNSLRFLGPLQGVAPGLLGLHRGGRLNRASQSVGTPAIFENEDAALTP